jgi:hypothetical protein
VLFYYSLHKFQLIYFRNLLQFSFNLIGHCSQNFWFFFCPAARMEIVIIILFKLKEIMRTVQICSFVLFSSSDEGMVIDGEIRQPVQPHLPHELS